MQAPNRQVFAVINQKGGVAKTTSSVNLAAGLTELGKSTLLIDLDSQAQSTIHCNVVPNRDKRYDSPVYQVLVRGMALEECVVRTAFGFDLLPSSKDLRAAEGVLTADRQGIYQLREALSHVPQDKYNVVILDCPPSLGAISRSALVAASAFLVPMVMQQAPLEGFAELLDTVEDVRKSGDNPNLVMAGVLGCNTPYGSKLSQEVRADLVNSMGIDVMFAKEIRYSEYVARGFKVKKPVAAFAPGTIGHLDYTEAAQELIARSGL